MLLGIDTFSLRWQGWDAVRIMDYAADLGLQNVHFSERHNLASHEAGYLASIRDHAAQRKLALEIGMRSFDRFAATFEPDLGSGEDQLTAMLHAAVAVGSPIVRCFMGMQSDRAGATPIAEHIDECVRTLRAVVPLAAELNVTIAVENHGGVDLTARELRALIERVGSGHVGVCLDTGNPGYAAEDAVLSAEILAPVVKTVHLRDTKIWATERGAMAQWVPAGAGDVDLTRIIAILHDHVPDVAVDLEVITGVGPKAIDYFDPADEFWAMYPDLPASDFARFVAVAQRGTAGAFDQLELPPGVWSPPDADLERYRAQQREHFERSVDYCRDVLGLGR